MLKSKNLRIISFATKFFLIFCIAFLIFCIIYYVKSRLPFQFSEKYSISPYFPFKYLYRSEIIKIPESGPIMIENFDSGSYFSRWYHLGTQVAGSAVVDSSRDGYNQSVCRIVQNNTNEAWSLSPSAYIPVEKGKKISFQAMVMKDSQNQSISLQLSGYKEIRVMVISKLARTENEPAPGKWELLRLEIQIPDGIRFIKPTIRGAGQGLFKIDNIELSEGKSI